MAPWAGTEAEAVTLVILDLDGTLLDTERVVEEVSEILVREEYGKVWDGRGAEKRLGKRPLEAAAALIADYELPCTPEHVFARTGQLLRERWSSVRPLPGASRLIRHLASHGVAMAVASSSPRRYLDLKLASQEGWTEAMAAVVAGDEVELGKPSPDIFLEAARKLGTDPARCVVIEDAPAGVAAGKAAGMAVVAVPSMRGKAARQLYAGADVVLGSLLDLEPERWGLPGFQDRVSRALPVEPWYVGGPVVKGFGRGSKMLGIPTANLATSAFSGALAAHVCGIYLGWAGLAGSGVHKMVVSVGWNPFFDNAEKTVEPWLLHQFPEDFYGQELRLVVVGYIRAEADFPSLEALVARIHGDARVAEEALDVAPFAKYRDDPYLTTPLPQSSS